MSILLESSEVQMVNLSDDVKIFASKVYKDALDREIFLGYESILRRLWLTKKVEVSCSFLIIYHVANILQYYILEIMLNAPPNFCSLESCSIYKRIAL